MQEIMNLYNTTTGKIPPATDTHVECWQFTFSSKNSAR